MPNYDTYSQYRIPLSAEESLGMPEAEEALARMEADVLRPDSGLKRDGVGFRYDGGDFIPNPVIVEHMGIAMQRAETQFRGWPAMPEDANVSLRFPGVDPVGKYSVIDMKVAQRVAHINATLESRAPEVQEYARSLLSAVRTNPEVGQMNFMLQETAKKHRILTRASKLCLDPEGRRLLHEQSRMLETDLAAEQFDKYLQGIEYAAGVKAGPVSPEISSFYRDRLQIPLNMERIKQAEQLDHTPREVAVEFENLDNKLRQAQFANPNNWGKTSTEVSPEAIDLGEAENAVPPYARATANRVIDPLFREVEEISGETLAANRGNNIIIDGKTVGEKIREDYVAAGRDLQEFDNFYRANYRQLTGEYVAAGLMAGKRIEAFVPDKDGRIPNQPVQITKKGYEPSALKKVTLNAWERFWSKRGFFKEKVAQAAEYQRMVEARERVKAMNVMDKIQLQAGTMAAVKNQYFADWKRENGPLPTSVPNGYSVTRSALTTTAVCAMLSHGYPAQDVFDPTKLQQEKQQMGREVIRRMQAGDQKWMGETLFHGQRLIMDHVDRVAQTVNLLDEKQLFSDRGIPLFFITRTAFDASQECSRCKEDFLAAAERYAPGQGTQAKKEVDDRVNTVAGLFDSARQSMRDRVAMAATGQVYAPNAVKSVLNYEALRMGYAQATAANPQTPMSKQLTIDTFGPYMGFYAMASGSKGCRELTEQLGSSVEAQKAFGRDYIAGRAQQRMHLSVDTKKLQFDFTMDAPSKTDVKQAERTQTLQQTAQKNTPKTMGGGGRIR